MELIHQNLTFLHFSADFNNDDHTVGSLPSFMLVLIDVVRKRYRDCLP